MKPNLSDDEQDQLVMKILSGKLPFKWDKKHQVHRRMSNTEFVEAHGGNSTDVSSVSKKLLAA